MKNSLETSPMPENPNVLLLYYKYVNLIFDLPVESVAAIHPRASVRVI